MGKQKMKKTNIIRDAFTGNPIRPNQEAILVKNIVLYARKLGYLISDYRFVLIFFSMIFLTMSVSALSCVGSKLPFIQNNYTICNFVEQNFYNINGSVTSPNKTWLDFDGVNDYGYVLDNDKFSPNYTGKFTLSLYVKPNTFNFVGSGSNKEVDLLGKLTTSPNIEWKVTLRNASSSIPNATSFTAYTSIGGGGNCASIPSTSALKINVWNFVVYKMNLSNCVSYLNGTVGSTVVGSTYNMSNTFANITYGGRVGGTYSNVSLDLIKIWNTDMTNKQIEEEYEQNNPINGLGVGIPVIMYHHVNTPAIADTYTGYENFSEQMAYLNSSGYETITFNQYYSWLDNNFIMPQKPIILTFDDGGRSVYTNASSIMDLYGYIGVVAITTGTLAPVNTANMNWSEVTSLYNKGWEIASHSSNHTDFTTINITTREQFFNTSYWNIYNNLSHFPTTFIFPGGVSNLSIDKECIDYYTFCIGSSTAISNIDYYLYKSTNLSDGINFHRAKMSNTTTINEFKLINLDEGLALYLKFNENNGTIAYDSSGNSNNGTIFGATWQTDGQNIVLSNGIDYLFDDNVLSLLNMDYKYSQINYSFMDNYNYTEAYEEAIEQRQYFEIEFNNFTAVIFFILFAICGLMVYVGRTAEAGIIIILLGFTLLFSGFTIAISFIIIALGVVLIFVK